MSESMKLNLKNWGLINEANIDIDKIIVVGGYNSTGKSILSKFLYCFLKSNSSNRQEIAYDRIAKLIREESRFISNYVRKVDHDNKFDKKLLNYSNFRMRDFDDFERIVDNYNMLKSNFYELDILDDDVGDFNNRFSVIDNLINVVEENHNSLYRSLMKSLLVSEFSTSNFNSYIEISDLYDKNLFNFLIDFQNNDFNSNDVFVTEGAVKLGDVYYFDSISILDMFSNDRYVNRSTVDHIKLLKKNLVKNSNNSIEIFDDEINKNIIEIEKEIVDLIDGEFIYENGEFFFINKDSFKSDMHNTASGVKQIGVIQLLLSNRKLKEDSFFNY